MHDMTNIRILNEFSLKDIFEPKDTLGELLELAVYAAIGFIIAFIVIKIEKKLVAKRLIDKKSIKLRFTQNIIKIAIIAIAAVWVLTSATATANFGKVLFQGTAIIGAVVGLVLSSDVLSNIQLLLGDRSRDVELGIDQLVVGFIRTGQRIAGHMNGLIVADILVVEFCLYIGGIQRHGRRTDHFRGIQYCRTQLGFINRCIAVVLLACIGRLRAQRKLNLPDVRARQGLAAVAFSNDIVASLVTRQGDRGDVDILVVTGSRSLKCAGNTGNLYLALIGGQYAREYRIGSNERRVSGVVEIPILYADAMDGHAARDDGELAAGSNGQFVVVTRSQPASRRIRDGITALFDILARFAGQGAGDLVVAIQLAAGDLPGQRVTVREATVIEPVVFTTFGLTVDR